YTHFPCTPIFRSQSAERRVASLLEELRSSLKVSWGLAPLRPFARQLPVYESVKSCKIRWAWRRCHELSWLSSFTRSSSPRPFKSISGSDRLATVLPGLSPTHTTRQPPPHSR